MADFNFIPFVALIAKIVLVVVFAKYAYTELEPIYRELLQKIKKERVVCVKCNKCGAILQLIGNRRLCPNCDEVPKRKKGK